MEGAETGVLGILGGDAGKCGVLEAQVEGVLGPKRAKVGRSSTE